jgi:hypothetical protein
VIATGKTLDKTRERMRSAIEFHLRGLRADGDPIPRPACVVDNDRSGVMSCGQMVPRYATLKSLEVIGQVGEWLIPADCKSAVR